MNIKEYQRIDGALIFFFAILYQIQFDLFLQLKIKISEYIVHNVPF